MFNDRGVYGKSHPATHPRLLDLRLGLVQANTWNPNINFLGLGMPGLVVLPQAGPNLRAGTMVTNIRKTSIVIGIARTDRQEISQASI